MKTILLSTLAATAALFLGACASREPAPVTTSTTSTETHTVQPVTPVTTTTETQQVHTY